MPRPKESESKEDYISRFMGSPEAQKDYPDQKQRAAVAYSLWEHRNMLSNAAGASWPKLYSARHIEPGLVSYAEHGFVLVQKPALDKMLPSFVGKPVINEVHRDGLKPEGFKQGDYDGVIIKHYFNEKDGWYWVDFLVWDPVTKRNCESKAYSVSCAYEVKDVKNGGGDYHNIAYEQEVLAGEYTHLAIVANPRYEGARIVYNSKGGKMFKLKFWEKKKEEIQNASEMDMEKAIVEIDGKEVPMKELIDLHNAKNAPAVKLAPETMVEIADGKKVAVSELIETFKNSKKEKKNDEDTDKKGKGKELAEEEDEEESEKTLKQRKNKEDDGDEDDTEKKKKDLKNEKEEAEGEEHFNSVRDAAQRRGEPQEPVITSRREQAAEGSKRYGSEKAA